MIHRKLLIAFGFVILGTFNMGASCLGITDINNSINNDVNKTVAVLDQGVRDIGNNLSSWKDVLTGMEQQLTADTQTTVRNELQNLLTNSIGVANAGVFCTVDFIGHRVIQALGRIRNQVLGQPAPNDLTPATCEAAPSGIEYAHWQQNGVPKVDLYGYDLNAPLNVKLINSGNVTIDASSALSRTSAYQVTINLGSNGVPLTSASQHIDLVSGNTVVSSIPVIQPVTPPCQTKTEQFRGANISFIPPHVGTGDSDYSSHGPVITANLTLAISGVGVNWTLFMDAIETQSDWTEVRGTKTGTFYSPPAGWKVDSVASKVSAYKYTYVDTGGHQQDTRYPGSGPVNYFLFTGDTDGDDVGRTGVTVYFNPIDITLIQTTNCVSASIIKTMSLRNELSPAAIQNFEAVIPKPPSK